METYLRKKSYIYAFNFDFLADQILNHSVLQLGDHAYRICEIEFYLNAKNHEDLYTHSCDDQKLYGYWYFHKTSAGNYKGGTFKGLDLTLGDGSSYCGVLIRSVMDLKTQNFIEGPCRSVDTFLTETKCENVKEFVLEPPMSALDNKRQFVIKDNHKLEAQTVKKGPRIGLSDKYPQFRDKFYRYAIYAENLKRHKM